VFLCQVYPPSSRYSTGLQLIPPKFIGFNKADLFLKFWL